MQFQTWSLLTPVYVCVCIYLSIYKNLFYTQLFILVFDFQNARSNNMLHICVYFNECIVLYSQVPLLLEITLLGSVHTRASVFMMNLHTVIGSNVQMSFLNKVHDMSHCFAVVVLIWVV